ncbi:YbaB/EbfC family nucleoid-associated protein [Nonomuraea deserti]|uniref:YbaB/EbfC family nucleoid-associated protein n=1 Tax=Nonomuraea deserti TaxID=1848322 RepID=UPI001404341C|nr:YbaB/EbfC family nucleoid-associated protein [Nonomuraea deserti]
MSEPDAAIGRLESLTGTGESPGGRARAVVSAGGLVEEISLGPRAMRMTSQELTAEVLAAVEGARTDERRKAQQVMSEALGEAIAPDELDPDKVAARLARMLASVEALRPSGQV